MSGVVDYDKLLVRFGCGKVTPDLLERFQKVTGKPLHHWLKRGLFFAQRDFGQILDHVEKGKPMYIYTGRGPSSDALHLGHLVPFIFTKYLQDAFGCQLVIQLTDDEKFLWKNVTQEQVKKYTYENMKDIIAVGFDPKKTFIFSDYAYIKHLYPVASQIQKLTTGSTARAIFGVTDSDNVGKWMFSSIQASPSFPTAFPHLFGGLKPADVRCLIPCAIDQDPYFRLTRDVAQKMKMRKPALIESKFFPALQGYGTKMSASDTMSAIYLTDTPKQIRSKINKYAFSGGQATVEDQRKYGANIDVDVSIAYLTFFMDDDERLEQIKADYKAGRLLSGEVKKILGDLLVDLVQKHQEARKKVTDEVIAQFTTFPQ